MEFKLDEYHRNTPLDVLSADLKRVANIYKTQSLSQETYDNLGKYSVSTYVRRFGSWQKALESVGLSPSRTPMNIPIDELFENLENIWINLGRQPRYSEIEKPLSKYNIGTYEKRFNGWRNALNEFVRWVNQDNITHKSEPVDKPHADRSHITSRKINLRTRFLVMQRDSFTCQSCGTSPALKPGVSLHVDHIQAWSNGGESVINNLQTLCSQCNIGKSNLT